MQSFSSAGLHGHTSPAPFGPSSHGFSQTLTWLPRPLFGRDSSYPSSQVLTFQAPCPRARRRSSAELPGCHDPSARRPGLCFPPQPASSAAWPQGGVRAAFGKILSQPWSSLGERHLLIWDLGLGAPCSQCVGCCRLGGLKPTTPACLAAPDPCPLVLPPQLWLLHADWVRRTRWWWEWFCSQPLASFLPLPTPPCPCLTFPSQPLRRPRSFTFSLRLVPSLPLWQVLRVCTRLCGGPHGSCLMTDRHRGVSSPATLLSVTSVSHQGCPGPSPPVLITCLALTGEST